MFKDLDICDEFTLVDVKDSSKAVLVERFKESDMTAVKNVKVCIYLFWFH